MAAHMRFVTNFTCLILILSCIAFNYAQNECQLPMYHMGNLTQSTWFFITNTNCLPTNETETNCEINMRFCEPIKLNPVCGNNASICETGNDDNYMLAGYKAMPFKEYEDPTRGFSTSFPQGQSFTYTEDGKTKTCNLSTIVNFSCNKDKVWVPDVNNPKPQAAPYPPIEIKFNKATCQYNITFEFAGACLTNNPAMIIDNTLSAGSVLVILFFVFTLAYFVFGSMWNIGCRGARGKEVIPNFEFWTMLPVYVADGVLFTFRCGQMEASSYDSI